MTVFLNSLSRIAKTLVKPFVCPEGDDDSWSENTIKEYNANSKARYALFQVLNDDISRVINCTCAYDIWQVLVTTHEGITQVKKVRLICLALNMIAFICLMMNLLMICLPVLLLLLMDSFL